MSELFPLGRFQKALADRYAIESEIGRGGMAAVYRAHDLKHDRAVAIKILDPQLGVTLGAQRFHREIAIESRLHHPNILSLFDSGQVGEFLYFVMPFAEGGSLRDRLSREKPLPVDEALKITREIGDALEYAHREGVLHRDVKPGNILLSAGHAVIADFGIAQALSHVDEERLTRSGVSIGTPHYMSPEQASGQEKIDGRSDLYSLACVLFEMLAGEPPFTGPTPRIVLARQISERPPSVEVARPGTPDSVASAVRRAMAKVPADRHQDISEFLIALEGGSTVGIEGPTPWWSRPITQISASILLVLGILAGWWLTGPGGEELSLDKVAVFPLATRGLGVPNTVDGAGVAYLIGAALEHAEPLRFIDVTGRLTDQQIEDPELVSLVQARDIAAGFGAGYMLRGVVQGHRDSTTLILQAYSVAGDSLIKQQSTAGEIGAIPLHHLGLDAIRGLLPSLIDPGTEVDLTPLRDRKANAVALWWQGEREYRRSNFEMALDLYERALAEDSAMAIAAVKGAQAADWIHENDRGRDLVELALARESLLPVRYALLAKGLKAFFLADAESAAQRLREALTGDPDWWEAETALGEVFYHLLPTKPQPDSLARMAFQRALDLEDVSPALFHTLEILIRDGDLTESQPLFDRFADTRPERSLALQLEMMRECVTAPRSMDWDSHTQVSPTEVLLAGKSLSAGGAQLDCSEGAFRSILASEETGSSERWGAFLGLQALLIATGRDREAKILIDSVSANTGMARSLYVLGTVAGARMEDPSAELDAFARDRFGPNYEGVVNSESLWVLSLWLRHSNALEQLERISSTFARRAALSDASSADQLFWKAVSARNALSRDTVLAIGLLEELLKNRFENLSWSFSAGLAPERLLLAQLLLKTGRYQEAFDAASVFDHPQPIMFVPFVPSSLAVRYEAAQQLGKEETADALYRRLQGLHRLDLLTRSN